MKITICDLCKEEMKNDKNYGVHINERRYFLNCNKSEDKGVYQRRLDICDSCYKIIGDKIKEIIIRPKKG